LRLGGGNPLFLIAVPCVIESEKHARMMAEKVAKIAADAGVPYIFKASYDKANRSSVKAFRGPGLKEAADSQARSSPNSNCRFSDIPMRRGRKLRRKFAMCCRFRHSWRGKTDSADCRGQNGPDHQ